MESINQAADTAPQAQSIPAFSELGLSRPLLSALTREGYVTPTPIQASAIPEVLSGRDLLGCAQTGTGKTAAFALPILERLSAAKKPREARRPRALVLSPTRELAAQIKDSFVAYGRELGFEYGVIFGGVAPRPQIAQLSRGVDVLIATPGRLLDLMNQGAVLLDRVEALVLDEADRMLDMGFLPDVRRVLAKVPKQRQTLLFSATMPRDIRRLAADILVDPAEVAVTPVAKTADRIDQAVYMVDGADKRRLLVRLLREPALERAIVFTRTKHGANRLVNDLSRSEIFAEAIHGNKSQGARQRALDGFKGGRLRVLVATDIAARGIDVEGISHVFNYDLPNVPESYVHRIGRTARAGAAGIAISLCSREERGFLRDIERLTRVPIRKLEVPSLGEGEREERKASEPERAKPAWQQQERPAHSSQRRSPDPRPRDPRPAPRPQSDRARFQDDRARFQDDRPRAHANGDRPRFSDSRPNGDRPRFSDSRPNGDRPRFSDNRPNGDRPRFSDNRPRPNGDRARPAGDRPRFSDNRPRRPWDQAPAGTANGDRRFKN